MYAGVISPEAVARFRSMGELMIRLRRRLPPTVIGWLSNGSLGCTALTERTSEHDKPP